MTSVKKVGRFKSVLIVSGIGVAIAIVFSIVAFGFTPVRIIKAVIIGFMITFTIGIFEYFVFQNEFKKLKFSVTLAIRTVLYVAVISFSVIIVWVVHESSVNGTTVFATLESDDFRHFITLGDFRNIFIFSIIVGFLINFFSQINSLLGKHVLLNYLTGRYHSPKEEDRAFMFLDLSSSTTIAEKLDPVKFHRFMNSYFFDIDDPIVESKGEIYQYVGDEVVISWKNNTGYDRANCIRCFFNIRKKIDELSGSYLDEYGIVPGFKAGLHCGTVVTGEIGDSKREIVFHGDVLNTASRIQSQCNSLNRKFLVSEDILAKLNLPQEFTAESMGKFLLRGKAQEIELYSIEEIPL